MPLCPAGHESAADDYCDACGRRMGAPAPTGLAGPAGPAAAASAARGEPARNEPAGGSPCPVCHTPRSGRFCEVCRFDFVAGAPSAVAPALAAPAAAVPVPPAPSAPIPPAPTAPAPPAHELPVPPAPATPTSAAPAAPTPPGPAFESYGAEPADGAAWSAVVTADRAYFDRVTVSGGPTAQIPFPAYCPERRFVLGRSRAGEEKRIGRYSASRGIDPEIDLTGPPTDPGISRLHAVLIGQQEGGWAVLDPGSENGTLVNDQEIGAGAPVPLHDGDRINLGAWTVITIHRS